jgi:hypothetical protein
MTKEHGGSAWFGDYGILMRSGPLCAASSQQSRTAAGIREVRKSNRPFCDSHHMGRSPVQAYCSMGWQLKGSGMIIATSGAKAPETLARAVIAWLPPPSALRRGADGSATIVPPSGWAICDGTKGTSDLSNRFIIDGSRNEGVGCSAGSATHSDNASVPLAGTPRTGGELATADQDRGLKTDPFESIPVTLVYIMKLQSATG